MTSRFIKGFIFPLALVLCLLSPAPASPREEADKWTSVQSRNFLLVGNASEREIRKVAARLEQFREAFVRLLPVNHFDSSVPLTVIVFKTDAAYRPFEPLYGGQSTGVVGFFQSNPDVDYITLSVDRKHVRSADALAFHEYVHLLVRNSFGHAPLWFNEGLAEYYSTFDISDGNKKVTLGKSLSYRLQTLRERELVPLEQLLKIDDSSPYYTEQDKRNLFYAQSWALIHYLLSSPRRPQLSAYLQLLAKGMEVETAFRQAFQSDFATLETELRAYLRLDKLPRQVITFDKRLEFDTLTRSVPLSEAEAQFYLGDLLLHTNRLEEAAVYLRKALALDPGFARAHASLGVIKVRQNRFAEAKKHLEIASAGSQNYLVHYYYAYVLSREAIGADNFAEGYYSAETTALMRAELKKAIDLAPNFAEAYRLLAFINLARDERLDESIELIRKAIELSPRRQEFLLLLAQVHLRREEFDVARKILNPLQHNGTSAQMRSQAQSLLASVAAREVYLARVKALEKIAADAAKEENPNGVIQPCDAPQPGPQLKKLRFSGEQACGMLVRIECEDDGVVLVVEAGERTLRLRKDSLNRIRFVTYTVDVRGQVTCGLRTQATPVLVTYRPAKNGAGQTDGEIIAVEFIPKEWNANH
jgi:tetratricopeptide (TPR) repeat protein